MPGQTIHFQLPDGLTIAGEESGDPSGRPLFFFHGWPASRLQGAGFGPAAHGLGIRILALDRPGIGLSTFRAGRRLLDWPPIVAEIARQLGWEKFLVLGVSGGGPYSLATAWALPHQVEGAAVVSGAPPLPPDMTARELFLVYRWLLWLYRRHPETLRLLFRLGRPFATIRPPLWLASLLLTTRPPADREAFADERVFRDTFACYQEAWRGSALGVAADGEIYAHPWGFDPAEIHVPVRLWHGDRDTAFAHALAERLGATIPGAVVKIIPEEGHFSLCFRQPHEILSDLISAVPVAC